MKNLITLSLEKIVSLSNKIYPDYRKHSRGYYHKIKHVYPFHIARRILTEYIGLHVNDAFTKYCTKVPKYQQKEFWIELRPSERWWRYSRFRIDAEGLIEINKRAFHRKSKPTYYSDDFKTEQRHKVTGEPVPRWRNLINYDDYEVVIISGYKKVFKSYKDKTYKRLKAEQHKRKKRAFRKAMTEQKEKVYLMKHPDPEEDITLNE